MTDYENMTDNELIRATKQLIEQYVSEARESLSKAWGLPLPQGEIAREQVEAGLDRDLTWMDQTISIWLTKP